MTDIVQIPETLPIAPFPALGSANYNQEAYDNGVSVPPAIERLRAIVDAGRTNALASNERAVTAASEANRSTTQANASASSASASATSANNSANSATASASSATQSANSATAAQNSETAAAASALLAASEAGRAKAAADSVAGGPVASINGKTGVVTLTAADIGPAATQAEAEAGTATALRMWSPNLVAQAISSLAGSKILRSARTSNVQLVKADNGKLIDITSGTFTQTFAAAATLGDGWFCYLKNSGSGDITLDPDASELIDGLTSYIMYPGEVRLVQCDGEALRSVVLSSFSRTFTASGTFIKPPGYPAFQGHAWGAGGSGSKQSSTVRRSGGAGGGCVPFLIPSASVPASVSIVIGAGGDPITSYGDGNPGGTTTFGSLLSVFGGAGGVTEMNSYAVGGGPFRTGAKTTTAGFNNVGHGLTGGTGASDWGGAGAFAGSMGSDSVFGGASGGGVSPTDIGQPGGISKFGGNGGAGSTSGDGEDGFAPGGGGGATQSGSRTGAGARGELRIWGII